MAMQAIELMWHARQIMEQWSGVDRDAKMFYFLLRNMYFCAGGTKKPLIEHLKTHKMRKNNLGWVDPYPLDSYLAVGVLYHELVQLDTAR